MALVPCNKCKKVFSDKKTHCPRCKAPREEPKPVEPEVRPFFARKRTIVLFVLTCVLSCVVATVAFLRDSNEMLAEMKPLPVDASLIPIVNTLKPQTLGELLALDDEQLEQVDIARISLLCAEGLRGSENLDVEYCVRTLNGWACHVGNEVKRNFHHFLERPEEFKNWLAYYRMGMMGTVLVQDMRIRYDPELERKQLPENRVRQTVMERAASFSDSRDVFLHGLLTDEHYGTCSSMPFLYAAIGRRLGYPVYVAARKGHLYVRYEDEEGRHLNMEATENRGFATPTDEEYRSGQMGPSMTDEDVEGMGFLRPLSNKEVLGICLLNRGACLRSMRKHDDEVAAYEQASRYIYDTPFSRRVIESAKTFGNGLSAEVRCDELLSQLQEWRFPTGGPKAKYFQNRKLHVQLLMNQTTNVYEVEDALSGLVGELRKYRAAISDFPELVAEAYSPPKPSPDQQKFLAMMQEVQQVRRVRFPEERVPLEYRESIPVELVNRLRKLRNEQEMLAEMQLYAAEEMRIRNLNPTPTPYGGAAATVSPAGHQHQVKIKPEDLPSPWRGREIPSELLTRLASLNQTYGGMPQKAIIDNEIHRFFTEYDQRKHMMEIIKARRMDLDGPHAVSMMGPPLRIEMVPSTPSGSAQRR